MFFLLHQVFPSNGSPKFSLHDRMYSDSSARKKWVYRCNLKELAQYLCVVSFSKLLGRLTIDNAPNGHFCSDNTAGQPGVNQQVMNVIVLAR